MSTIESNVEQPVTRAEFDRLMAVVVEFLELGDSYASLGTRRYLARKALGLTVAEQD